MTPIEQEIVIADLRSGHDPAKVARRYGLPYNEVREQSIVKIGKFKVSPDGLGRPELRSFIIAVRHVDEGWRNEDEKIIRAREQYDSGDADLATARDGYNLILYCFPRARRDAKRRVYFARNFGDG